MPDYKPDGYHTLTPYLIVPDGAEAMELYGRAFGAEEVMRLTFPDGGIAHAEMRIGDSLFMLAGASEKMDVAMQTAEQWPSVALTLYVPDNDAAFRRAADAGFTAEQEPTDMFWGDRMSKLRDPYGHCWSLLTLIEEVSIEEAQRRMDEL
ncbi:MAG: VOC family protein, partial [Planctomycetota bacterium]